MQKNGFYHVAQTAPGLLPRSGKEMLRCTIDTLLTFFLQTV